MPTFCRHNRFFAECPICSKGTVLDPSRSATRRPSSSSGARSRSGAGRRSAAPAPGAARASRGPFVSAGPYDGAEVRLERVPGGLRMASWRGGQIERAAPVLDAADAPGLLAEAAVKELLPVSAGAGATEVGAPEGGGDGGAPAEPTAPGEGGLPAQPGAFGSSPGRSGELRDELRVERLDGHRIRVARWIDRPNRGWELQEAPVLLPPARFTQALAEAARKGVLVSGGPAE
ncbi:MAG TPA: hypothetical protein VG126_05200 [Thermoleophilaceae bacterium]|nr:hypothetical protein [Thermoleophilaceae bacterium]